jgi:hypothetical protein
MNTNQLKPCAADRIEEIIEERRIAAQAKIEAMGRGGNNPGKPPKPH